MLIVLIINIISVLASITTKDKLFKQLFLIVTGITLLFFPAVDTIYRFLLVICMFVFDYIALIIYDEKPVIIKYIIDSMFIIFLLTKMNIFDYEIVYLIASICFIGLHLISKERPIKIISLLSFAISTNYFISSLSISTDIMDTLTTIIPFGVLYYLLSTDEKNTYYILKIVLIIVTSLVLLNELNTTVSILVCLAVNVLLLITNIKSNNIVYKTSFVLTILSIIYILDLIDEVPTFVYMLIFGLIIIVFIYRKIKKFISEPHIEETKEDNTEEREYKVNFCGECGNKLSNEMKFCPKCGNKIRK